MHRTSRLSLLASFLVASSVLVAQPGFLDPDFNGGWVSTAVDNSNAYAADLAILPDGKIVVAGYRTVVGSGEGDIVMARFLENGQLDATFGNAGLVITDLGAYSDIARAVAIQPDGKIVVAAVSGPTLSYDLVVGRYLANGSSDTDFGSNGWAVYPTGGFGNCTDLAIQSDGKIILSGERFPQEGILVRFTANGILDASFGESGTTPNAPGTYMAVDVRADDRLVATRQSGGNVSIDGYTTNGSVDGAFGTGGTVSSDFGGNDYPYALLVQADGSIAVAGWREENFGAGSVLAGHYTSSGVPDAGFGTQGLVTTDVVFPNDAAYAMTEDAQGRLILAGYTALGVNGQALAMRYEADGSLDATFGNAGTQFTATQSMAICYGVAIGPNGRIIMAGSGLFDAFEIVLIGLNGNTGTSIVDGPKAVELDLFPIPFTHAFHVEGLHGGGTYTITDLCGRVVAAGPTLHGRLTVATERLAPGTYTFTANEGDVSSRMIVKE